MHCDQARSLLFDLADHQLSGELSADVRNQIDDHLAHCSTCQADYQAILAMRAQANSWHEVPAPAWQPPTMSVAVPGRPPSAVLAALQSWFPSVASAAALALVLAMYLQPATLPQSLPRDLQMDDRFERQQELTTVVRLVMDEMDRRAEQTEASLRYVIAHQLQDQEEIDDLYERMREISFRPARSGDPL